MHRNVKIAIALSVSFIIASFVSNRLFIQDTPRINLPYITSFPQEAKSLLVKIAVMRLFPTPTVRPSPIAIVSPGFTFEHPSVTPRATTTPVSRGSPTPTSRVSSTPTVRPSSTPRPSATPTRKPPTPTRSPTPTTPPYSACPTTSGNSYISLGVSVSDPDRLTTGLSNNPDVNLYLRGFGENGEEKKLISRNGNNYGLDEKKPPQLSTLFGGQVPTIIKTYDVYEWDFQNNVSLKPQRASPNFPVHMVGLSANPGQQLVGLQAGRDIGNGNVFMVLYATQEYILFTHARANNLFDGYLYYFIGICVDPNLLSAYQSDDAGGRRQLPVIASGQVFGTASNEDVKASIRDTMSFVDPRAREDWWFYPE